MCLAMDPRTVGVSVIHVTSSFFVQFVERIIHRTNWSRFVFTCDKDCMYAIAQVCM